MAPLPHIFECHEGGALFERIKKIRIVALYHWAWAWRFQKPTPSPELSLSLCLLPGDQHVALRYSSAPHLPECHHVPHHDDDGLTSETISQHPSQMFPLLRIALVMISLLSNRMVPKTEVIAKEFVKSVPICQKETPPSPLTGGTHGSTDIYL